MTIEPLDRVIKIRTRLLLDNRFFGVLALRLALRPDASVSTAYVDGKTLGFNPRFIDTLTDRQLTGLVAHEVMHCALEHPYRRGGRDHLLYNVACDIAINQLLKDSGFELPPDALMPDDDQRGKSAEYIYSRLPKPQPRTDPTPTPTDPNDDADQEPEESEEGDEGEEGDDQPEYSAEGTSGDTQGKNKPRRGDQSPKTQGEPDDTDADDQEADDDQEHDDQEGEADDQEPSPTETPSPSQGEVRDAPTPNPKATEADNDAASWRDAVAQAAAMADAQGQLPGALRELITEIEKPRIDWRSTLRRYIQEHSNSDYSWQKPSRRYTPQGIYMPSLDKPELSHLAVAVDTSGSMDSHALACAQAELTAIIDEAQPRLTTVYYADSRIARVDTFEKGEPVTFNPVGRGGTDFRPVVSAVNDHDNPPVCLVYITDLIGMMPEESAVPIIWLTDREPSDWQRPQVGEVLTIDD